tara:strand:+ start:4 stop:177 length:174 start_codon:yes stop_codon:yes gene_type:complete
MEIKNGISKQYYKNGEVRYFFLYKNNQLNGESKYYSSQGKLIDTMIFIDGEPQDEED